MENARKEDLGLMDRGEFTRLDPKLIKLDAGAYWREETPQDLEALKSSITWRERRMKGSGLLVPLLVSKIPEVPYYQLEDGFRRFRAVQSLMAEGLPIDTVPVRVLPQPLTMSERLMLMTHGSKPLGLLEEARIVARLENQGLSLQSMSQLMDRDLPTLKKRSILGQLKGPVAEGLRLGTLSPQVIEARLSPTEDVATQQARLERELNLISLRPVPLEKSSRKKLPLGEALESQAPKSGKNSDTQWMSKTLDPTLHYVALEGLYEWMGGEDAVRNGYSKKVVEIVKMMLKYCGGAMGLAEVAEKLKKH